MIVIKEGFRKLIAKSINALILYILVPVLVYGIIDYQKQNILVCLIGALISFFVLNFYVTEKTVITATSIKHIKSFLLLRREVLIQEVSCVEISTLAIESWSYSYLIRIKGKKQLNFGFVSTDSLITFVRALKSQGVKLEITPNAYDKIKDKI